MSKKNKPTPEQEREWGRADRIAELEREGKRRQAEELRKRGEKR
ncbi:MAG: hypothetical protein ACRDQG_14100 [Pseudonocardiaceae bacterium]